MFLFLLIMVKKMSMNEEETKRMAEFERLASEDQERVESPKDRLASLKDVLVARKREYKDKAFSSMSRKQILFWMNKLELSFEELVKIAKEQLK